MFKNRLHKFRYAAVAAPKRLFSALLSTNLGMVIFGKLRM